MGRLGKVPVLVCAHRELSTVLILPPFQPFRAAIYATHESPSLQPRITVSAQRR